MNLTDVASSNVWVYSNTPGSLLARFLGVPSDVEGDGEEGESGQGSSSTATLYQGLSTVALFEANLPNDHGGSGC